MTLIGIGNAGNGMFWSILAEFIGQTGSQIGKYGFLGRITRLSGSRDREMLSFAVIPAMVMSFSRER